MKALSGLYQWLSNPWDALINLIGVAAVLYHIIYVFQILESSIHYHMAHMGFALVLVFLAAVRDKPSTFRKIFCTLMVLMSVVVILYLRIEADRIEIDTPYLPALDLVIGMVLLVLILGATWVTWGPVLPVLAIIFILYFFLGDELPHPLKHADLTHNFVIGYLGMTLTDGYFGVITQISATFVFLFVVFGILFQYTGILPMFLEVGKALGNLFRAGPAYTALVGSSLVAMVSGTAMANVIVTGSVTIPTMKASGFQGYQAGAIEAVASSGGQITPPIMGVAAFIMAGFLGVSYIEIAEKAVLGALVYYVSVAIGIYLLVRHAGIHPPKEPVNWGMILPRISIFVIPLAVIIALLLKRYSPNFAATYGIFSLVGMSVLTYGIMRIIRDAKSDRDAASASELLRESPQIVGTFLKGVSHAAVVGSQIAVVLFCVGTIAQTSITTGLGTKISEVMINLSGGQLLPMLLMAMVVSIILGIGLPISAVYILVVVTVVPSLLDFGVDIFAAHFFVFYFAIVSGITPPVALAVLPAARLAEASFMQTSLEAFRLGMVKFFIPFAFVAHPEMLGLSGASFLVAGVLILLAFCLGPALYSYFMGPLKTPEVLWFSGTAFLYLAYIWEDDVQIAIAAMGAHAAIIIWRLIRSANLRAEKRKAG